MYKDFLSSILWCQTPTTCQIKQQHPKHLLCVQYLVWNFLSYSFYCCDETPWPKSKLGRKGLIWLTHPDHSSWLKEAKAGTQDGILESEVTQRHGKKNASYWLPLLICSVCFLTPRTTCSGEALLTGQSDGGIFTIEVPSVQMILILWSWWKATQYRRSSWDTESASMLVPAFLYYRAMIN